MSINRLPDYLDHMQQAASDALSFVEGVSREESHIKAWRAAGYHVSLFFLALPDAAVAVARVAERVRQGGHDVPEEIIRRRFTAGMRNFENTYKPIVTSWARYDNMGKRPILLEWGENS